MELFILLIAMGVGATATMDLWALLQRRTFGIPSLDYALVGRWLGHMPKGRFVHDTIAAAPPVSGEKAIGWIAHYLIGVAFAGILLLLGGAAWVARPNLGLALGVGLLTVAAPFFLMQPAMGFGVAASRLPNPHIARLRGLMTHLIFGAGLFGSAWLATQAF
ncbi:DUF2938 domain-containing protein [Sphingosinicella sp. LHD-64]|uniref:DUF2938 domain-containing protein n=1 Tax=Sphingosinicella sp. LHD-64 TaxID=3072139 RepID=UPI0028101B4B|nr:DUF2938 domain-containing protein [Sphingosinicella sp. LHD-64]MDQ8755014.1 DUF2938 domain-containing protein [Sphingosinicella sp. LHD-64]